MESWPCYLISHASQWSEIALAYCRRGRWIGEGQGIHPLVYVMFPCNGILTGHEQRVAANPSQYVLCRSFVDGLDRTRNRKGETVLQCQNPVRLPTASKLIQ